jgi:hypothetical protein
MGGMDWIDLAQDQDRWRAVVNTAMNLRVSQKAGNSLSRLERFSFSGRTLLHGVVVAHIRMKLCIRQHGHEMCPVSLNVLCSMCTISQQRKDNNEIVPRTEGF